MNKNDIKVVTPRPVGWLEYKLNSQEMDYVWKCIKNKKEDYKESLAGNISGSYGLYDRGNWFWMNTIKPLILKYNDEFSNFVATAEKRFQEKGMTFDDMYTIMNQGTVNQNVANSTKESMLNQMRNVREMPVSQSSANSQQAKESDNDNVFDALAGLDGGLDDMFNS